MNNHTIWDKDSTNICRLLQGIVLHFLLIMSYAPCEDWYSTRQYLRFLLQKLPCKRVKLCVYNNQYKPAAFSRKCMCMIFISTFPEKIWWILYCECQRNSADLHYSKGFHPYQSSLVNKGFNMQPDWDSFSCCNKASKQVRLILSIK